MAPPALTSTGLVLPTVEEIIADVESEIAGDVDPLIGKGATTISGQYTGIVASHDREILELVQAAFDALDPDNAEDALLDNISAISGTTRLPARKSKFSGSRRATVNLAAGATLPIGSVASVIGQPTNRWLSTETATNPGGSAANFLVAFESELTGVWHANTGTLTVIAGAVAGWNSVTNTLGPILGADVESDQALRLRREAELRQAGSTSVDGIRSDILALRDDAEQPRVIDALVLENTTDATVDGIPPHGVEAVVWDGGTTSDAAEQAIAEAIFASKAAGIPTSGSITKTVADSYGNSKIVKFSRSTERTIGIAITLRYAAGLYIGDAAVKTIVADAFQLGAVGLAGTKQRPGKNVSFAAYMAAALRGSGITQITLWRMNIDGGLFSSWTDLPIGDREIAITDVSEITISSSLETP